MTGLTNSGLWQHSVDIYSKTGVADACLTLQDRYAVNVNLLLLLHWCVTHRYYLDDSLIALLKQSVAQTDPSIQVHRTKRRAAKGTVHYEALKATELELEAQQQAALVSAFNQSQKGTEGGQRHGDLISQIGSWLKLPDTHHTQQLISTVFNL